VVVPKVTAKRVDVDAKGRVLPKYSAMAGLGGLCLQNRLRLLNSLLVKAKSG